MFEDSLIESSGQMKAKKGATVLISTVVHVVLITVLILIPLISYSELPKAQLMTMLIAPPPPPPPPPPAPVNVAPPKPEVIKQVQIDPGPIVQPTEYPKAITGFMASVPPLVPGVAVVVLGGILPGSLGGVLKAQEKAAPPPPPPPPPPPAAPQRVRVGG